MSEPPHLTCLTCGEKQPLAPEKVAGRVTPEEAASIGWLRTVGGWFCPKHSGAPPGRKR